VFAKRGAYSFKGSVSVLFKYNLKIWVKELSSSSYKAPSK